MDENSKKGRQRDKKNSLAYDIHHFIDVRNKMLLASPLGFSAGSKKFVSLYKYYFCVCFKEMLNR
ncbi:MAG: hypothetical protein M3258_01035 [Thermoproteota archaeon]|nr:hypothetical protein [Thermoproteota archaeon]